ncbi:DUF1592 domain-containing protein [Seongchinamella unica]|uniref:DUF1592 domain-containing protein n=1 Tax=Seongchinamella unica TaxID=2547392 RepID=A0A4R5LU77_9GAMM|nr:DUF1592 domain-containing protein [Seongchinamella unica]TDG14944.1 DUF1592 domain-containing protein [Seongchinamella unica]
MKYMGDNTVAVAKGLSRVLACSMLCWLGSAMAVAGAALADGEMSEMQPTMRLISQPQYLNTVRAIFGPQMELNVRFAPLRRMEGMMALGAGQAIVTSGALDSLDRAAHLVAEQVVAPENRQFTIPCQPVATDVRNDACASQFIGSAGRLLYRRALTKTELHSLVELAGGSVGPAGDFYDGLELALVGMLLSPNFLFIQEHLESDPQRPGGWRLDAHSKASRLSLMLWASGPDTELIDAAESGVLHTDAGLQKQVERMLASRRLRDGVRSFFNDFLILEGYDNLTKDETIFPAFNSKVLVDAREQQLQLILDHLIQRDEDYRDLFTTRHTMLTANLAAVYGFPVSARPSEWVPYELAVDDERGGFLTQVGFLAQHAHPGRSSPTRRGKALREIMLCQHVPDAPPNVDFSALEDADGLPTARERLDVHNTDRTCRGCHAITDPIGLGLENFDGAGQFRKTEKGFLIDPAGTLDRVDFETAVELGSAVRDNPALTACLVQRVYTAAIGRPLLDGEEAEVIDPLLDRLDVEGYRWKDVLRAVTLSDAFFGVTLTPELTASTAKLAYQHED